MGMIQSILSIPMGAIGLSTFASENASATNYANNELRQGWESEESAAVTELQNAAAASNASRRRASITIAAQRVAFAANNVDASSGTAAKFQESAFAAGEDEAVTARANAMAQVLGHKQTAQRYRRQATENIKKRDDALTKAMVGYATNVLGSGISGLAGGGK